MRELKAQRPAALKGLNLLLLRIDHALPIWELSFEMVRVYVRARLSLAYVPTTGRGVGVVVATGVETEFGVIFSMMQDVSQNEYQTLIIFSQS